MALKQGDKVKVEYKGTLDDGTVFDSSEIQGKPLEIEIGSGQIIPGFENALMDMDKDDEKDVTLKPEEAYGQPNEQLVQEIPKQGLKSDQEPQKGMSIMAQTPDGKKVPGKITDVTDSAIKVDFNHPLAGQTLHFKIKLAEVS